MGLTEEEFFELTPAQFDALLKRHKIRQEFDDYRAGIIASTLVQVNVSAKESKKYPPDFFFPSLKRKKKGKAEATTPKQMKDRLKFFYPEEKKKEDGKG